MNHATLQTLRWAAWGWTFALGVLMVAVGARWAAQAASAAEDTAKPTGAPASEAPATPADKAETKPAESPPEKAKPTEAAPAAAPSPESKPGETKPAESGGAKTEGAKPAEAKPAVAPAESKLAEPKAAAEGTAAKPAEAPTPPVPEPKLRFNFRFQRWVDVLEEVANQAGLSLVLDAPPPGTFNYSDAREYTPREALDLVNGVLITKGYTLVRREKMLVLVDLAEGIPEGLIPRVPVEELAKYGKFEMVTVLLPLKNRSAEVVTAEIKPLLGPHGKVIALPSTGQLLLTDTAGIIKTISAVIESMPAPVRPAVPVPVVPPERETPVHTVYPVKVGDPETALKVLKTLAPLATFALDPQTNQIHAYAGPSQQALVKNVLEQMESNAPADKKPRLETYEIEPATAAQTVKTLTSLVEHSSLTLDPKTGKLIAWAPPAEQETIKGVLEKLGVGGGPSQARQFEVHRLTKLDPTAALTLLQELFPSAKISLDKPTGSLVVVATIGDQNGIKAILQQLQPDKPGPSEPELKTYAVTTADPSSTVKTLKSLYPNAQIALDANSERFLVTANPAEQAAIKAALEQIQTPPPAEKKARFETYLLHGVDPTTLVANLQVVLPSVKLTVDKTAGKLVVFGTPLEQDAVKAALEKLGRGTSPENTPQVEIYRLTKADPTTLVATLQPLVPDAKLSVDPQTKNLIAVAVPADQKAIKAFLEQLQPDKPGPNEPELKTYPVTTADTSGTLKTLKTLYPNAQIALDANAERFLVTATPAEQAAIKTALDQIQAPPAADKKARFETYQLHGVDPTPLVTNLQTLLPNVKLLADKTGKLIVWGTPPEHETVKAALEKLGRGAGLEGMPQLEVYRLTKADPTSVMTTLQSVAPEAKLTLDAQTKSLIVLAVPADQKAIRSVLEQLQPEKPPPDAPQLRFYPLAQPPAESMLTVLKALAPKAQITYDTPGRRLTVVAAAEDHATLKGAIEQIELVLQTEEKHKLVTYTVSPTQQKRFRSVATTLTVELPGIQIMPQTDPNELVIWAKPSQQIVVAQLLEQLGRDVPHGEKFQVMSYPLKAADANSVLTVLQAVAPNAQVTVDARGRRLLIWAPPTEHEAIQKALEKIDGKTPAVEAEEKLMVYPVQDLDATIVLNALKNALPPDVRLVSDTKAATILAWAMPWEHETISQILKQMQAGAEAQSRPTLAIYPVPAGDPATIVTVLKSLVPKAQVAVEANTRSIAATALAQDHALIRSAVEQLAKNEPPELARKVVVYPFKSTNATAGYYTIALLRTMFPDALFSVGAEPDKLVVMARPKDHEAIKPAIEQVSQPDPPEQARRLNVYVLESSGATTASGALATLTTMFPEAKLSTGLEPGQIIAWARPAEHEQIAQAIQDMFKKEPPEKARQVVVYPFKSASVTAASYTIAMLRTMFPDATFTTGAEPDKLAVLARPKEHEAIKSTIEQLSQADPPETARRINVYTLETTGATSATGAMTTLTAMFPEVRFSAGLEPGQLIAWARPTEHIQIAQAIQDMSKKEPPATARRINVYTLETTGATSATGAMTTLTAMFPEVKFSAGLEPGQLIAWARPAEHVQIAQAIQDMSKKEPPDKARKVVVYPLKGASSTTGYYTLAMLRSMFPEATFTTGAEPDKLVVLARPKDHEAIKSTVEQIAQADPPETARRINVYTLESSGATGATGAIATLTTMFPEARFSAGLEPGQLIAWARPAEHQQIAQAIEDMSKKEPPDKARKVVVYTLKAASSTAGSYTIAMLRTMFPEATFTTGAEPDKLVVLARPKDHEGIKSTVEQIAAADPPESARRINVYTLETSGATSATGAITTLTTMFPEARFSAGLEPGQLIAWARPAEHQQIAQAIEDMSKKEPPEKARKVVVYPFKAATATAASYMIAMLRTMFPEATFTTGAETDKLVVLARPKEHEGIKSTIEQIAQADPPETARRINVYTLETSSATSVTGAITTLTSMFPEAKFSAGLEPSQLIAWARPAEQQQIAQAIEEMSKKEPPDKARTVVVYPFKRATSTSGYYNITMLRTLFPDAQFSTGAERDKLVVLARPKDHAAIKATVDQIMQADPPETARRVTVYTLETPGSTSSVLTTLTAMFPEATFTAGTQTGQLIAWARPTEHEQIARAIQDMSKQEPPDKARRMAGYTLEGGGTYGLTYALTVLRNAFPDAIFSVGSSPNHLLAWARPAEHEAIQKAVEEMSRGGRPTAQVYRFEWADPRAAYAALSTLVPNAQIALDTASRSLVVSASAEDHAKIKATVAEMDRRDPKDTPQLEVHHFKVSDPANLLPVLQGLFRLQPQVQLSLDERNAAIIALATPTQQATIRALIEQVEREAASDAAVRLQVYPLGEADAQAALRVVHALLEKQGGKAEVSIEPRSNSLVAIAHPEQHKAIQAALEQIKPDDRTLEILQLDVVDPETAELAILRLFSGESYATAPSIDVDAATQQVFVRATQPQHEKIRDLLTKMGETGLLHAGAGGPRFRVFPFDGDLEGAVEEIKRIWPQLRSNPIEIVDSLPEVLVRQRRAGQKPEPKKEETPRTPRGDGTPPAPKSPAAPPPEGKPAEPAAVPPNAVEGAAPQPPASAAKVAADAAAKPITVVPGDGTVSITSDDPAALRQFETLLRAMSRHRSIVGRNYAVFLLRNAKAPEVAATLQQIFRTQSGANASTSSGISRSRWARSSTVVVVPDERLNAIVAFANRTDRAAIEGLLKVLDSADLPDSQVAERLQIIPIENARAETIAERLRDMFKTQLDGLSVDETNNSLIVVAAPPTMKEVQRVISMLDEAAGGESSRTLEILPLRVTNSERMQSMLQTILKGQPAKRKTSSSRSRN